MVLSLKCVKLITQCFRCNISSVKVLCNYNLNDKQVEEALFWQLTENNRIYFIEKAFMKYKYIILMEFNAWI